ncbi:hypothetical protein EN943_30220 [Mesorhizobium sp. M7A.F.Ca.US.006.01.1.1]|uniref:substrate-binding domain-containing protein n=1 Tax=Mesorhizobium sp. M7A.F.Ca.US.006.01.1.1 TaxID=2496707 RepID=UPI000FCC48AF|nr:substrate-binding domain-containing protein [Mesorhizobium sp. M7A.F.Ca.US.006.01.1.1]RUZ72516.1 hypothetical protein EN943_30220 [Mesorhizobium sp. M7A.F.Ca.US.006.01.1.1]
MTYYQRLQWERAMKFSRKTLWTSCIAALGALASSYAGAEDLKIANLSALVGDPYFISMKCGAEAAAKELGVNLLWNGSTGPGIAEQVKVMDALKLQNPDGWMLTSFSSTALIQPIKELMAAGKPVVLADGTLDEEIMLEGFHSDNSGAAEQIAKFVSEHVKGKAKIGVVASFPGNPVDQARYEDLPKTLAKLAPNVEVLPFEYGKVDSSLSAKIAAGLILAHPDLTVLYATNGAQAQGVISAVRSANAQDRIMVVAYDATPDEVEGLRAGRIQALIAQSPYLIGKLSMKAVVDYLRANPGGAAVKPKNPVYSMTPIMMLTKDNIDTEEAKPFPYLSACAK